MSLSKLAITAYTLTCASGCGRDACVQALANMHCALRVLQSDTIDLACHIGEVSGVDQVVLPTALERFDCRNHRLAEKALLSDEFIFAVAQTRKRYGSERIGLFLGTSTSGIAETERAYQYLGTRDTLPTYSFHETHTIGALVDYVRQRLELRGPAYTISTACSSSAKVFGVAQRHIASGWCDAAIVGGVDSLCMTTLYGFHALQLLSSQPARPWGAHRDGISIGEGAGFAILEPQPKGHVKAWLLGYGESSDAYHMSAPHPTGAGACLAIKMALEQSRHSATDIDYINLHGTGTRANDASEDLAITEVFGTQTWCSSTKGAIGHTLGSAGIIETLFTCMALEEDMIPGGVTETQLDSALCANFATQTMTCPVHKAATLSLGFGGSNCCLILGKA